MGGLIHVLLMMAVFIVLVSFIQRRRALRGEGHFTATGA